MIEVINLQKVVEGQTEIDIDSFTIDRGEIVAVIGPVGSKKSVFFNLLIGQTLPTMGEIRIKNLNPISKRQELSRHIGVLFPEDGHYQNRTVEANLNFHCRLYGVPKNRIEEVLAQVGLLDHSAVRTGNLSSSLARRLSFGRILLHEPKIFILSEPFSDCDEQTINLIKNLIRELADHGSAILIFDHDAGNLNTLCETIYEFEHGRIINTYHPQDERRSELPFKIPVRLEGRVALVNPGDIIYAEVIDGKSYLHTNEGSLPTQYTLGELEERLVRSGFFRAHRAYLVNLQHVRDVIPYTRNSFSLRLDDQTHTEIPLSKSAASELKTLLDY